MTKTLHCDVCGDPAMTSVLKDAFGKSDQVGNFCAVHAPKFSAIRPFEAPLTSNQQWLPCPFCGHRDIRSHHRGHPSSGEWVIECHGCSCELTGFASEQDAWKRWNARPSAPETSVRHDVTCNYPRGPLYGPGCICMVVNKHVFERLEAASVRYDWLRDWYHREGKRSEIDPHGHIAVRTIPEWEALLDAAIARGSAQETESSAPRGEAGDRAGPQVSPQSSGKASEQCPKGGEHYWHTDRYCVKCEQYEKAPVKPTDVCPAFDHTPHEERKGKCIYCGAPMESQSSESVCP